MSTHNICFLWRNNKSYPNYHQIPSLSVPLQPTSLHYLLTNSKGHIVHNTEGIIFHADHVNKLSKTPFKRVLKPKNNDKNSLV